MSFLTPENYNNAVAFVMAAYALQFLFMPAKIITDHGGVINYRRRRERTEFRILLSVWRDEKEDAR